MAATAAAALLAAVSGGGSALADNASLTVTYTTPTSIQVTLADGSVVHSGTVVPAGSYMVYVKDDPSAGDQNPNITINGPGVSLSNNLNSSGMGIDGISSFGPFTFQTSSSYAVEDSNLGASTLVSFTTSATASATSSGGTGSSQGSVSSAGSSSSSSSGKTSGSSSGSAMGSAAHSMGTVDASISAKGTVSVLLAGKALKSLKAGSYTLVVVGHSAKATLIVGELGRHPTTITLGTSKVTRTLALAAGRLYFEARSTGPKTYVTVSA